MFDSVMLQLVGAVALLAYLPSIFISGQVLTPQPLDQVCLGCLCEAVSDCQRSTCEGDVCGLFRITWAYWADAGKPVLLHDNPADSGAYGRCANDPVCASKTVSGYMEKFAQDCNGDGVINCVDYAHIHRHGGYGCNKPLDQIFANKFYSCQKQVAQLTGPGSG